MEIKFPPSSWVSMSNTHKARERSSQREHAPCSSTAQQQMEVQSFLLACGKQPWNQYLKLVACGEKLKEEDGKPVAALAGDAGF